MSDLLLVRVFFYLTLMTIAINIVGWYGLGNYYRKRLGREKSGERDASKESKFSKIITPVIRLEFVYFLLLFPSKFQMFELHDLDRFNDIVFLKPRI